MKANTYGSVVGQHAAYGGILRDNGGFLLGCFAANLGAFSVFKAEIFGFILAMDHALQQGWG